MPLTLTDVTALTQKYLVPRTTDVIFKRSPVLVRLRTKRAFRYQGGTQIQRPIIVAGLIGDAFGRGDTFNINYVTTDSALVVDMKTYYVNITLYGRDSMLNREPLAVFSLLDTKFQNASLKMAELLGTNMWLNDAGARANHLTGFSQWYDDGNVYTSIGGITRSDVYTVGQVGGLNAYTATLTSFTLRDLNRAYTAARWGSDHVDLIAVTPPAWAYIWEATQPSQRYVNEKSDLAQIGFESFRFNAADVVIDQYLPTGSNGVIFGMNTNYIEFYISNHPLFQFGFTGFKPSPNTIDVAGQFCVGCNIVVSNPRTGFKLLSTLF